MHFVILPMALALINGTVEQMAETVLLGGVK